MHRAVETRRLILDEVLELAGDEESQVREAALEALLNMTSQLDDGERKQALHLCGWVMRECVAHFSSFLRMRYPREPYFVYSSIVHFTKWW